MGFRKDFAWGAATSSYQIEGAVKGEGKGKHIWDIYTGEQGHVFEGHTGEIVIQQIIWRRFCQFIWRQIQVLIV